MHFAENKGSIQLQVADWLREHAVVNQPGFGRCKKIVLRHMNLENKPQGDVQAFVIPQDEGLIGELDMLVNRIVDAAQRSANDYASGVQKYALYAYYTDDTSYVPFKVFRVAAEDESARGDLEPSEPPTEKGLVSQLMRHNEATMKNATMKDSFLFSIMQRELSRLSDKDERSESQRMDMMMLVQDTLNEAHGRRLSERKEETDIALREGIFEQLKVLMPIVANRIAGKPIFPEEDKSFLLMATFLENLRPEQQAFLRDSLDGPQMAVLAEIFEAYEKKKAAFTEGKSTKPAPEMLSQGNALPPAGKADELPSLPEGKVPRPMKLFAKLSERVGTDPDTVSKDSKLQQFEQQGAKFASRFSDFLTPPKK